MAFPQVFGAVPGQAGQHAGTVEQPCGPCDGTPRVLGEGVSRCDDAGAMDLGEAGRRQRVSGLAGPFPRGFSARQRGRATVLREEEPTRCAVTEGGRSDSPPPLQAQHAADHTRPKSMWPRVTRRCSAFMQSIEQYISRLVNYGPDAGRRPGNSRAVGTCAPWPHTTEEGPAPPRVAAAPADGAHHYARGSARSLPRTPLQRLKARGAELRARMERATALEARAGRRR